jgi:hypothetical protein
MIRFWSVGILISGGKPGYFQQDWRGSICEWTGIVWQLCSCQNSSLVMWTDAVTDIWQGAVCRLFLAVEYWNGLKWCEQSAAEDCFAQWLAVWLLHWSPIVENVLRNHSASPSPSSWCKLKKKILVFLTYSFKNKLYLVFWGFSFFVKLPIPSAVRTWSHIWSKQI